MEITETRELVIPTGAVESRALRHALYILQARQMAGIAGMYPKDYQFEE